MNDAVMAMAGLSPKTAEPQARLVAARVDPYRALDLFCKAGGVSKGLSLAGFDVVGVDIERQPNYPFAFVQADALRPPFDLSEFDFIWASPPCQAFVSLRHMYNAKAHADLIPPTRALLEASGRPYAIENVNGAPLYSALRLCGTQFGLGTDDAELWRHRHIETNFSLPLILCRHREKPRVIGVYGGHGRDRRRKANTQDFSTAERREAMGIDWMNGAELSQAIPPAYSEFIGRAALAVIANATAPKSVPSLSPTQDRGASSQESLPESNNQSETP